MLALSRSTRAAHTLRLHARAALSTVGHRAAATDIDAEQLSYNHYAPDDQSAAATQQVQTQVAHSGDSECLYVSPWDGIRSSAEGLSIARAVQNKYGAPAKEVVFLRVRRCATSQRILYYSLCPSPAPADRRPLIMRRTSAVSTSSSRTFGSYLTTRTCAGAFQRGKPRSPCTSQTSLGATAISVSKR